MEKMSNKAESKNNIARRGMAALAIAGLALGLAGCGESSMRAENGSSYVEDGENSQNKNNTEETETVVIDGECVEGFRFDAGDSFDNVDAMIKICFGMDKSEFYDRGGTVGGMYGRRQNIPGVFNPGYSFPEGGSRDDGLNYGMDLENRLMRGKYGPTKEVGFVTDDPNGEGEYVIEYVKDLSGSNY